MTTLGFLTGNESAIEVLSVMFGAISVAGIVIFYITMIKPKQDEKRESKRQGESAKDIKPADESRYEGIIDDYPTYHR